MAQVTISIVAFMGHLGPAIEGMQAGMSERERDDFSREWDKLSDAGAEMIETDFVNGRGRVYPAEDFVMHLRKWGAKI